MLRLLVACLLFAPVLFCQTAPQNVYGCEPLPSNSVFYARIDSLPLLPQSATYIANMGTPSMSFDSSMGVTLADAASPVRSFQFYYTPGYSSLSWVFPPYYQLDRQAGSLGEGDADHHSIVVQHQTCQVYELYHDYMSPVTGAVQPAACGSAQCTAQSGFQYWSTVYAKPAQGTTDAAGLPLLPLIWRAHEIMDGTLNHPARFTLARGYIQAGNPMWPAEGTNGWGGTSSPPYGARFRLAANTTISLTSLTPTQQQYATTIINAMKQYGLVLADIGTTLNVCVDDEVSMNPDIAQALATVGGQIHATNLEVPDLSSLELNANTYQTTLPLGFDPANQAMVGTPYSFLNIQAGMVGYQLNSWVNGSANQGVIWSVQSGNIGTVTADGLYTPPANVPSIVTGMLKVTAAADANAYATVYVRVLPAGPIRVIAGNQTSAATDHLGQVWQPNVVLLAGDSTARGGDYPGWPTPQNTVQAAELPIYESFFYTYGNDIVGKFIVPNGNYRIHFLFGQPYYGKQPSGCTFQGTVHGPLLLESQYLPIAHNYDFGADINHQCAIPVDFYMPAAVTNNSLEFALRNQTPLSNNSPGSPMLSGFEILPDTSQPHLTIDSQQETTVAAGASVQLYAVGWYMSNSVSWSILSGPGSISSDGVYTAPLVAGATSENVTIAATSESDPDISTTLTLTIPGVQPQAQTESGLQFIPITPCRVVDTRNANGPFGGPILGANTAREYVIRNGNCGIPASAVAYSLNFTVVPTKTLGYLAAWPSGQSQPSVSTLNSDGRIKANAAIMQAGSDGGIQVYATDQTHVVIDINGYFVPAGSSPSALAFYPLSPCRVADTRNTSSAAVIGASYISAGVARNVAVLSSNCGVPPSASAYSLNITVVPHTPMGYLTVWPAGTARPTASTLNAGTGAITANAAIVPAGANGEVSLYSTNDTDVVIDINGYFDTPGTNGLAFYPFTPCRLWDSRLPSGSPPVSGQAPVGVTNSSCIPAAAARALLFNTTVVPVGGLGYLSIWPASEQQPLVSTLNAADGAITSNMAIVPVGNGSINLFAPNPAYPVLDLSGYFAP